MSPDEHVLKSVRENDHISRFARFTDNVFQLIFLL